MTTDINIINVNGLDYPIKDQKARDIAESAVQIFAYYEDGLVASQAYATIGTPICWKGDLYYTIASVAKGEIWEVGVNLRIGEKAGLVLARVNDIESELTANGNRIYMDYQNGKYGYNTDPNRGADTFNPFRGDKTDYIDQSVSSGMMNDSRHSSVLTFNNLTRVDAIVGWSLSGETQTRISAQNMSISGNTVTISEDNSGYHPVGGESSNGNHSITVTARQYHAFD